MVCLLKRARCGCVPSSSAALCPPAYCGCVPTKASGYVCTYPQIGQVFTNVGSKKVSGWVSSDVWL